MLDYYYRLFLGRSPGPEERAKDAGDVAALVEQLGQSVEYRGRFRDAALTDENARASIALWPPQARDYELHIVVVSGAPWSKARETLERLAPQLGPKVFLTMLCGDTDALPFPSYPGTEVRVFPGEDVFRLRARLPAILKEAAWVGVLEDHALPMDGWLPAVRSVIAAATPDTLAFTGTAANEISTTPWEWAGFLFNFAYHWHPSAFAQLQGSVATTFFRRDLVGATPLRIHHFEFFILGRRLEVRNEIRVNHRQHGGWWWMSQHSFDNGRVAGNAIRRNSDTPAATLVASVRWVWGVRLREIAALLKTHPRGRELPSGTIARIYWIALCHSTGVILGGLVGSCGAEKLLE